MSNQPLQPQTIIPTPRVTAQQFTAVCEHEHFMRFNDVQII